MLNEGIYEGVEVPCCNTLTLQPEQSGGRGSNPTSTFERHDKGLSSYIRAILVGEYDSYNFFCRFQSPKKTKYMNACLVSLLRRTRKRSFACCLHLFLQVFV